MDAGALSGSPNPIPVYGGRERRPGARGPAALRVLLYVIVWFGFEAAVQVALGAIYVALMLLQGGKVSAAGLELTQLWSSPAFVALVAGMQWFVLAGTLAITWAFVRFGNGDRLVSLGFQRVSGWLREWCLGFALELPHMGGVALLGLLAGYYRFSGAAPPWEAAMVLTVAVLIALPAAAVEEISMRGYVLQTLESRYGTTAAVAVNSVVFALLHSFNPGGFQWLPMLGLVAAGIYLSVAYLATRRLWLPIAMHVAWNVLEGPVFGLPVSGMPLPHTVLTLRVRGPELFTGGAFGPEAGLPVLIITLAWSVAVWHLARRLIVFGDTRS